MGVSRCGHAASGLHRGRARAGRVAGTEADRLGEAGPRFLLFLPWWCPRLGSGHPLSSLSSILVGAGQTGRNNRLDVSTTPEYLFPL